MSEPSAQRRLPPRARDYAALVLGVWAFFAGLGWMLTIMLRARGGEDVPGAASRGIVTFFLILGVAFAMVALFDWAWLTFRPRADGSPAEGAPPHESTETAD